MKPKTRLQVEVWGLHQHLMMPREHEAFISAKHDFYYSTHYKNIVCLECNHTWKPSLQFWAEEVVGVRCPSCDKDLKKINFENGQARRIVTYSVVQVVERFQVVRYFSCWKHLSKKEKPNYYFRSLFEEWTDYEKNKKVVVGRNPTWSGDGFNWSDYEVRYNKQQVYRKSEFDRFASNYNCPGAKFLPRFDKYGLGDDFHDCDYRYLLQKLERSSQIETLLKAKQKELLFHAVHKDENYSRFWPQIKIALRHKYDITDAGIWYDYLQLLRDFDKDINSPKFVCPKNLNAEHDRFMKKRQVVLDAQARARELADIKREQENIAKCNAAFEEAKSKFFHLNFTEGNISIHILSSVQEFQEEGLELKHCVYTNAYYKKKNSLIMSARVNGVRTETIELSLKDLTLLQVRGSGNQATVYNDQIKELIKKNIPKIKSVLKEKPTKQLQQANTEAA